MVSELAPKERIVFPLDVSTLDEARELVVALAPYVGAFKVGYELGYNVGWYEATEMITKTGGKVFLDTKLNDIPNTVGQATAALAKMSPWAINVHASAGIDAMRAAVDNKGDSLILAVTVLTAISPEACVHIFGATPEEKVVQLALDAAQAGTDGLICSAQELKLFLGQKKLSGFLKMTPGIRPAWAAANDQKRIMTPTDAIQSGVDYLVIGRPIRQAPVEIGSPAEAAQKIAEEIANALNNT